MSNAGPSEITSSPEKVPSEDYLFNPPKDLICPITQALFVEPVVNSVGQIYEKDAFLQYLESSPDYIDPLTKQKFQPEVQLAIHGIKGRALEYREDVTRRCVELASQRDCPNPLDYLRRAAELAHEVPGFSNETISKIVRSSNKSLNGTGILMSFAEDLLRDSQQEKAANVYYALLQICEDKSQQPELLKNFILCWAGHMDDQEDYSLEKLMPFVENQTFFSWGEIVDIMYQAGLDKGLILTLCEELISRDDPERNLWNSQKEVMIKYIEIRCGDMEEQQVSDLIPDRKSVRCVIGNKPEGAAIIDGVERSSDQIRKLKSKTIAFVCFKRKKKTILLKEEIPRFTGYFWIRDTGRGYSIF